ncbi:Uncharacterised protein [Aeromonas encheleia]|uniref:hypothetical protein n=1 Tax=Aeromonas encheleia TaxID=73010 RepID=UPI0005B1F5DE|nr:hypothetical protein [Aeromonas encheleia]VEG96383.1 Uncharacterised protein [Aeromonas encheleia]
MSKGKLKFISSDCGSGKTKAMVELINSDKVKTIVTQNTIKLMEQTHQYIKDSILICSTNVGSDECVMDRVVEFLKSPTHKVLIISDKSFSNISVSLLQSWRIFVDDVTTFSDFKNINEIDPDMKKIVQNKVFSSVEVFGDDANFITAQKTNNKGDLLVNLTKSFSIVESNDKFFMNSSWFLEAEKIQLGITAFRDMSKYLGFDITFMANNFEKSTVYLAHPELFEKIKLEGLSTRVIPVKERLKVFYFTKRILSKTWKDANPNELKKVYDHLSHELPEKYYWTNNNSDTLSLSGTKISPDARGINSLQSYDTCVWLACMRPNPVDVIHSKYAFGIDGEQLVVAREHENIYQFVNRGVVRDYDSSEIQTVYVFSEEQALSLVDKPEYIDLGLDNNEPKKVGAPVKLVTVPNSVNANISRYKKENPTLEQFRAWVLKKKWDDEVKELVIENFMKKVK